jgi:hypothetical protein
LGGCAGGRGYLVLGQGLGEVLLGQGEVLSPQVINGQLRHSAGAKLVEVRVIGAS